MKRHHIIFTFLFALTFVLLTGYAGGASEPDPVKAPDLIKMVLVKGGCFKIGNTSTDAKKDEQPLHEVCLSDFYIGKYEVTQTQWKAVMGEPLSSFKNCEFECPVRSTSWDMSQEFIKKLNASTDKEYRLPTEAEWEYAARSGGKNEKWAGTSNEAELKEFGYYDRRGMYVHDTGLKKANGLGLYDMNGNVVEWCQDWYSDTYYAESPKDDPKGPDTGKKRVLRGGIRFYLDESTGGYVRAPEYAAKRFSDRPNTWDSNYGFRLVLPVTVVEEVKK